MHFSCYTEGSRFYTTIFTCFSNSGTSWRPLRGTTQTQSSVCQGWSMNFTRVALPWTRDLSLGGRIWKMELA